MVDLLIAYSKHLTLLSELVSATEQLRGSAAVEPYEAVSVRSEQAPRVWRVSDRMGATEVERLISCYRDGTTARELAEQFKVSLSSVKRLLRERKVRRRAAA